MAREREVGVNRLVGLDMVWLGSKYKCFAEIYLFFSAILKLTCSQSAEYSV